jgi:hypothetical protein
VKLLPAFYLIYFSLLSVEESLAEKATNALTEAEAWEYSLSAATYIVRNGPDYVNPVLTADRSWLHLEARYNYEALKTGSVWLGYNFSFGDKLVLEATPMLGGLFGNSTGVAPGYTISVSYDRFELFTQGEYFIDAGTRSGDFFYTWTELSVSPVEWLRLGLVIDRTKAFGSDVEIRRGPLLGFTCRKVDFTTYWLSPGSINSTFILSVGMSF